MHAQVLLSAPRGRRLCWEVLEKAPLITSPEDTTPWTPLPDQSPELLLSSARAALRHVDLDALQRVQDPALLLPALAASVDSARYWQGPDDTDLALHSPDVQDLLLPVAEAVLQCPAALWWDDPVDVRDQHRATEQRDDAQPPGNPDSGAELAEWRRATVQDEKRAAKERPADPAANWGGWWWSAPALTDLIASASTIPGSRTPLGLILVEDSPGARRMHVQPVEIDPAAQVYEVSGPDDWALLVAAHPLKVTSSRRHDWWRATGWSGPWVIPDWAAVAEHWDGVHVTVNGYLSTAGLPVTVASGEDRTMLAGWNPGTTWWLTDLARLGPALTYGATSHDLLQWAPVSARS